MAVGLKWIQLSLFMNYFCFFPYCKSFLCTWGCPQVPAAGLPRGYGWELGVQWRDGVLGPGQAVLETSLKMLPKYNKQGNTLQQLFREQKVTALKEEHANHSEKKKRQQIQTAAISLA